MAKTKKKQESYESIGQAVKMALKAAHYDREVAVDMLLSILADNPLLYEKHIQPLITTAAKTLIGDEVRKENHVAWKPIDQSKDIAAVSVAISRSLLDGWRMENGKVLGDATKDEVIEEAAAYQERARDNQWRAAFLMSVSKAMTKKDIVRDKMSETKLRTLQDKASA